MNTLEISTDIHLIHLSNFVNGTIGSYRKKRIIINYWREKMNRAQQLLIILMEECNEVAQQASKALRFGIDEQRDLPTSNRERLESEWNDLLAVVNMLEDEGIHLRPNSIEMVKKKEKVERYLKYSESLGVITE